MPVDVFDGNNNILFLIMIRNSVKKKCSKIRLKWHPTKECITFTTSELYTKYPGHTKVFPFDRTIFFE